MIFFFIGEQYTHQYICRASYGTTKYCTYYLRNLTCPNPNCLYLHEQGEDIDTISKEELATGKHQMRDMLTKDENADDEDEKYEQPYTPPTSQARPQVNNSEDFPVVSSSSNALPASASWAKVGASGSTPTTPVMSVSDAFGPTLSAAVAATQQKTQFPPMPKRKSEKKKRKEQLQQQQKVVSEQNTPVQSHATLEDSQTSLFDQGLSGFVLGQAYRELCPLSVEQSKDEEELTLGVSALLLEDNIVPEPSPAQRNLEAIQSASTSNLISSTPSVLDFLTYSTPTPKYNGVFNPFSHLSLLGTHSAASALLNNSVDSPLRKHSRFGFAQA